MNKYKDKDKLGISFISFIMDKYIYYGQIQFRLVCVVKKKTLSFSRHLDLYINEINVKFVFSLFVSFLCLQNPFFEIPFLSSRRSINELRAFLYLFLYLYLTLMMSSISRPKSQPTQKKGTKIVTYPKFMK
jgi:hypothetical protein